MLPLIRTCFWVVRFDKNLLWSGQSIKHGNDRIKKKKGWEDKSKERVSAERGSPESEGQMTDY
jgi:hypothetical protein